MPLCHLSLLLCLRAEPAQQAQAPVVILRPVRASERLLEASRRLDAELRAGGFIVRTHERHPDDRVLALEAGAVMALRPPPLAALSVFESEGRINAGLWRIDRETGKPVAWRVSVRDDGPADDRSSPPQVLAIRAVELLHASLTGVVIDAPRMFPPAPATTPATPTTTATSGGSPAARLGDPRFPTAAPTLGAGLVAQQSAGGIGPALAPSLTVGVPLQPGWALRASAVGFGGTSELRGVGGSAFVRETLLAAEVLRSFSVDARLTPFVSAGVGAGRIDVDGAAAPGYEAGGETFWALLLEGGGGIAYRLSGRIALQAEGVVYATTPGLAVRLAGDVAGRAGRPSFLGRLSALLTVW
jgi:hypothetical protein